MSVKVFTETEETAEAAPEKASRDTRATQGLPALQTPPEKIVASRPAKSWGRLPEYSVVGALGLLLVAFGDAAARSGEDLDVTLFWCGLILVIAPAAGRLLLARVGRRESLGIVVLAGFFLYLVKVMHSPVTFTFFDEFLHWRTLGDLVTSDHLFNVNPLLPTSALFPGLEIVTGTLSKLSGLPFFSAALVLLGAARLVFLLALYLIFEQITRSHRMAGVAALVYMTNPNFVFFDADFSYESMALPLATLTLFIVIRRHYTTGYGSATRGLTVAALLAATATVLTHHITSYVLLGMLVFWTFLDKFLKRKRQDKVASPGQGPGPGGMALFVLVATASWILNIAGIVINYLSPHIEAAVTEMSRMIARDQGSGRQLFENSTTGVASPIWERVATFGAVGLVMLGLPFGLWVIWKNYRTNPLVLTLAAAALLYPVSLGFRLTKAGWEAANRSSEFLYFGVGLVFCLGIIQISTFRFPGWLKRVGPFLFSACVAVLLLGGVIAGWNPSERLPEPFKVENGSRSVEPQGIEAARWAYTYLGPNNFMGVYGTNMNLMGSYGDQNVSTTLSGGINVAWVLFAPQLQAEQLEQIQRGFLKYFVVDLRLAQAPYLAKSFYPDGSLDDALTKFNKVPQVDRIFDSGDIIIYDIGAISGAG